MFYPILECPKPCFTVTLTFIDEGGKVMKMFLLFIFAYFPHCCRFLIAGDPRQNRAHQGRVNGTNCHFNNQDKVFIFERALVFDAAKFYQNHQHRQFFCLIGCQTKNGMAELSLLIPKPTIFPKRYNSKNVCRECLGSRRILYFWMLPVQWLCESVKIHPDTIMDSSVWPFTLSSIS